MSKPKMPTKKERDEAYTRSLQVDLEQSIAETAQDALQSAISPETTQDPSQVAIVLPDACPACGRGLQSGRPDIWTPLHADSRRVDQRSRIQCGQCAHVLVCTVGVWEAAREIRRKKSEPITTKKPPREKRVRGAE